MRVTAEAAQLGLCRAHGVSQTPTPQLSHRFLLCLGSECPQAQDVHTREAFCS